MSKIAWKKTDTGYRAITALGGMVIQRQYRRDGIRFCLYIDGKQEGGEGRLKEQKDKADFLLKKAAEELARN